IEATQADARPRARIAWCARHGLQLPDQLGKPCGLLPPRKRIDMAQPQGALLAGSVNYNDAETRFRTGAEIMGGHLKRLPDGEVGDRYHWIIFQADVLGQAEGLERVGDEPRMVRHLDARGLRIADGVDAASI